MTEIRISQRFGNTFQGELITKRGTFKIGKEEGMLAPYDLMLGALGACYYSTFIDIALKMRLNFSSTELDIRGVKRDEVPTTLQNVDMTFTVIGAADEKGFQRAAELAAKYCSVHETISKVADISLILRFEQ